VVFDDGATARDRSSIMKRAFAVAFALIAFATLPARAFDRVVHYDVVYAVAIANHFSPHDAAIIARASQSLDDNLSTTAFDPKLLPKEIGQVASGEVALSELPHMRSGQVFHALTEERTLVEQAHIARIEAALHDPNISHDRQLLYLGEYLHFVADVVVHPTDPMLGHAREGHEPDRADLNPEKLTIATALLDEKVRAFQQDSESGDAQHPALVPTQPIEIERVPDRLYYGDPDKAKLLNQVDKAVVDSWARTYPSETGCSSTMDCAGKLERDLTAPLRQSQTGISDEDVRAAADLYSTANEEARQARAASEIARVLNQNGETYTVYHSGLAATEATASPGHTYQDYTGESQRAEHAAIPLDANGEPTGSIAQREFGASPVTTTPFADTLAGKSELHSERERAALVTEFRASADAAVSDVKREVGFDVPQDIIDSERKAAVWVPPSSPGGIALDPRLDLPLDDLGTPQKIETDGVAIFLVTDRGRYRFDDVSLRSFATIARTIAVGQIPYLSIGSEPSSRPGYARVTYAPALQGTVEGHALYDADIQFKTIFAKLPLSNQPTAQSIAPLFADFPGAGGDFVRFWITSSDVVLLHDGDRLVTANPGMRINSETRLNFATRSDPEMEAYTAKLTEHWADLAHALPSFRAVQRLALTTAIVFWARDHGVAIDPVILTVPPETSLTPDYAPLVGALDTNFVIAGGVALTPEDRETALGHVFLSEIGILLNRGADLPLWVARIYLGLVGIAISALALVLPGFLLWRIAGASTFRGAVAVWAGVCLAQIVIVAFLGSLILGDALSFFDRNFLALLSTLVLFPVLLFAGSKRWLGVRFDTQPWRRRAALALGLFGPLVAGSLGLGIACATIAATGPVPSPTLNRVLTAEVSPYEAFGEGLATMAFAPGARAGYIIPVPRSLMETQRPDFILHHFSGDVADVINPATGSPFFPTASLKKIEWPGDRAHVPGVTHYSVDGKPPF
jgi:hypothetical protein